MHTIHYRPIRRGDFPAVGEILNQAFGLHRYVPDPKTLASFKLQYVYSCLSEATYTCVAEQDGQVIGIIMGNARRDYRPVPHLPYAAAAGWQGLKMRRYSGKHRTGIQDFHRLHQIYQDFSRKHRDEFDGVLTLFAVNEACRGLGVGKALLAGLLRYLRSQETERIYLYTDTTCNFGFYEHLGFTRLETQPLALTRDGQPFQMDVFLYGYSL